jgi:hypothetical protein
MKNKILKKNRAVNINFTEEEFKMIESIASTYGNSYSKILRTIIIPNLQKEYQKLLLLGINNSNYEVYKAISEGNSNFLI